MKAVIHSAAGKDMTLCMVGANSMFGTCCCFGGGEYPCNSMAETDTTVAAYPMKDFLELLGKYPAMSKAVAMALSQRLRQSKEMQVFEQESVEKRVLHVLVGLVAEFGNTIPLTRREVAEMSGTTVETCIRTFSPFGERRVGFERPRQDHRAKRARPDRKKGRDLSSRFPAGKGRPGAGPPPKLGECGSLV